MLGPWDWGLSVSSRSTSLSSYSSGEVDRGWYFTAEDDDMSDLQRVGWSRTEKKEWEKRKRAVRCVGGWVGLIEVVTREIL